LIFEICLELGIWNLEFVWILVLGAWNLFGAWDLEFVWNLVLGIWNLFGIWCLVLGICLDFGAWNLEFKTLEPVCKF